MTGIGVDDVAMFDLYSCFPSAVQMGLDALGLKPDDPRPLTVTGGLPYAGGPGNNYVMHSVANTVERLRKRPAEYGLVTGLGWFSTKHSAGVYSARRPSGEWQRTDPEVDQRAIEAEDSPVAAEAPEGPAVAETYTVLFNRDGEPEQGIVIGRLEGDSKARFVANTPIDRDLMLAMTRDEFVGRQGRVSHDAASGKNLFVVS
jgi:acetyl-CoA C-acetyltransferase